MKPLKAKSELTTLLLLTVTSCAVFLVSYLTLYSTTAMPGNKMTAGFVFGLAESTSSIMSGVVCSYIKDSRAFTGFLMLNGFCQVAFYFLCGGESGSIMSLVLIFGMVLGIGSCINIVYLLIEQRVPSEKLGSTIVVVITGSILFSSLSPAVAYAAQPVPIITGVSLFVIGLIMTQTLP